MGSGDERQLAQVVGEVTAAADYDLEELTVRAAGRRRVVRVVIDADGGVTLDAAAQISRAISERLDASGDDDPTGTSPYTLEVTSPGIGRPLTLPRHFRRARTRLVVLVKTDGKEVTGHVLGVTDTGIELVLSGRKGVSQVQVPFDEIDRARVEVEFSRPPAAVLALLGVADDPAAEIGDEENDDGVEEDDDDDDHDDQDDDYSGDDDDTEDDDDEDNVASGSSNPGSVTG
jgi:ribosome maturation factor RimP